MRVDAELWIEQNETLAISHSESRFYEERLGWVSLGTDATAPVHVFGRRDQLAPLITAAYYGYDWSDGLLAPLTEEQATALHLARRQMSSWPRPCAQGGWWIHKSQESLDRCPACNPNRRGLGA